MTRTPLPLLVTDLNRNVATPLHHQLYTGLRHAILTGQLAPGSRLPATRALASDLDVSRNTVLAAYDQLHAEGYLDGRTGSGTFITAEIPETRVPPHERRPHPPASTPPDLGPRGRALSSSPVWAGPNTQAVQAFSHGLPALDVFPAQTWGRLMARAWRDVGPQRLGYQDPAGYLPLREAIASYLRTSRAVRCDASQLIVTSGAQQALYLAGQLLLEPGDAVWFEDPGYRGARSALGAAGLHIVPVPVDDEGLSIDVAERRAPGARAVYVTPSHQYPLGVTMSAARRLQLLAWARRRNGWIIEDDYDSEYRYAGRPLASLQGLDTDERVLYVGTFSKVLCPALRLGYLVVPQRLAAAFAAARGVVDRHSATVDQMTLARFIEEGHLARHIRRMRALYKERQEMLVTAVSRTLAGRLEVVGRPAGLHLIGWLPDDVDDRVVSARAGARDVHAPPLSAFYVGRGHSRPGLVLGYAGLSAAAIRAGIRGLAAALGEESRKEKVGRRK